MRNEHTCKVLVRRYDISSLFHITTPARTRKREMIFLQKHMADFAKIRIQNVDRLFIWQKSLSRIIIQISILYFIIIQYYIDLISYFI